MKATEILKQEHVLIERILDLLTVAVERVEAGKLLPPGFLPWAIDFIFRFAHRYHDAKEEDVLFPMLQERRIAREGNAIDVILQEHARSRIFAQRMYEALLEDDDASLLKATADYVALLRQHITKENTALFPMADDCIPTDDDRAMVEQFRSIERDNGGPALQDGFEVDLRHWERMLL